MKDKYCYPAILHTDEAGISVAFPDLPGCYTCGQTAEDAMASAREALSLHLYGLERDGDPIPDPSPVASLDTAEGDLIGMIEAWMAPYRARMANRAVKKTLTIPKWLDDLALQNRVNFSQLLQEALRAHLGLDNAPGGEQPETLYPPRHYVEYVRDTGQKRPGRPAGKARSKRKGP